MTGVAAAAAAWVPGPEATVAGYCLEGRGPGGGAVRGWWRQAGAVVAVVAAPARHKTKLERHFCSGSAHNLITGPHGQPLPPAGSLGPLPSPMA